MPPFLLTFVRVVDAVNRKVGRFAMYILFVMMGILLWSSASKILSDEPFNLFDAPAHWTLLSAQFAMVSYFILGGPYSMQMGSHVRMDLLYGAWSPRGRAVADAITALALLGYLAVLLWGGLASASYAIEFGETSRGLWRAPMWPIKVVMCAGIFLMLMQALAQLVRDIALLRGKEI